MIRAVIFDLDGVLIDSEQVWNEVREELARERGGRWHPDAQRDMMGMSSPDSGRHIYPSARSLARMPRGGSGYPGLGLRAGAHNPGCKGDPSRREPTACVMSAEAGRKSSSPLGVTSDC